MNDKKKVGVVTIIDNINYGTILQAFGLCDSIQKLGYEVELIDYRRANSTLLHQLNGIIHDRNRGILKRIIYSIGAIIFVPYVKNKLKRFLKHKIKLSKKYVGAESVKKDIPPADIYVTGSDQVWNTFYNDGIDDVFFLKFTDKYKISYASSIGMERFPEDDLKEIKESLTEYTNLSVREKESCRYLESIGINNVTHCIDPTFLLTHTEWMIKTKKRHFAEKEKYLLVYSVEERCNKKAFEIASQIAPKSGLKVYVVTPSDPLKLKNYRYDKIYSFADCDTFLNLMDGASFIVASSFHGTAFAINFRKQFITVLPDKFNIRVNDLVAKLNLENRVIGKDANLSVDTLQPIEYNDIDIILSEWIRNSMKYLKTSLESK